ncbi:MAG: sugar 3,4-ketoisomerase [Chitinophagales bacterium]
MRLLTIPKIPDVRGNISFLQYPDQIPFEIRKVYWINDIPSGADRDGQANKHSRELIIALSGSFEVIAGDGFQETRYSLNRPDMCLYIPKMIWRQLVNFSTNSVALIITDEDAGNADNFIDFSTFQLAVKDVSKVQGI